MLAALLRNTWRLNRHRSVILLGGPVMLWALLTISAPNDLDSRPICHEQQISQAGGASTREQRISHLASLGADHWHRRGKLGQGVKIAILDSGFRGYETYLGKGLPARVKARSFRNDENLQARDSQHGILCGEIIHALAPRADLLFANWEPNDADSFLAAVRWAKNEGAQIISCSVIVPSWSDGEGGGAVHPRLHRLLGEGRTVGDVLCFASAGNLAERHWSGNLVSRDGWHCWKNDAVDNTLTPWGDERVSVECYGPAKCEYEVLVLRQSGELIGKASCRPDGTSAVVRFEPAGDATYQVRVRLPKAPENAATLHVTVLGGKLEHTTSKGSIAFPADGAAVFAVGAVDARRRRESYSSCGPNSHLPKPDFVATVPFPSACRAYPFTGTSAAAPQAAGLAALLWTDAKEPTPSAIIHAMRTAAVDLGPPGHDYDTGYGLIRLPTPK